MKPNKELLKRALQRRNEDAIKKKCDLEAELKCQIVNQDFTPRYIIPQKELISYYIQQGKDYKLSKIKFTF